MTGGLSTGLNDILANGQSAAIYDVCIKTMGTAGVALAMVGVIACPITSGDTAFRSARLVLADWFKIDQGKMQKRLVLCVPLLAVGAFVGHLDYSIELLDHSSSGNIYERGFCNLFHLCRRVSGIIYSSSLSGRYYICSIIPGYFYPCDKEADERAGIRA